MSDDAVQPTFRQLIASQQGQFLPVDDVLFLMLPLLRTVAQLHGLGLVASLSADMVVQNDDRTLHLRAPEGREPKLDVAAVDAIQPRPGSGLNIVGEVRQTSDAARGTSIGRVDVQRDAIQAVTRPIYLPGFQSWEIACGHHDEITDIFQFGQMLACLALGLNFDDVDDLESFAAHRGNLFAINARLHPVIAKILVETTALNRHERTSDLVNLIHRLETWRDQPVGVDMQRVFAETQAGSSRRLAVLSHLRDRLFDLSRRNRLLHFRPTASSVNMTVASVPLVMQIASIRPGQLCTWGGEFAKDVIGGEPVGLQKWLRFEDQPYLPTALDRIIQEAHRDRAEFGFSSARLVIAFLRWNNLKEAPDERIVSPLLWLPVEITKKKGVRDQYVLQCEHTEAEFNPALRHYLRQLCDIQLPDRIDLEDVSLDAIHADLAAQIQRSEPGVDLRLQTRPSIELIHQKAVQRLQQFNRRRGRERLRHTSPAVRPDFSYDRNDYRPLGLALFRQRVQPSPLPLRGAVGAAPLPRQPLMAATSDEVEHLTFALQQDSGHRYAWDLDLTQVTLANFHYKKMSLVRDYAQLIEEGTSNIAFDRVFSIEPKQIETDPPQAIPLSEQWNVVASDATQDTAVSLSRTGRSFIIQGPPGTGKSQTITNLIADFAARGKRVLFVCEKRAALDVVYHRLKQSGLDDLCCLIHDSQDDKKAFIADLRECYARWTSRADELSRISALRNASLAALSKDLERIEQFEQAMRHMPDTLACTVRNLIRRLIALPRPDASVGAAERERLPDYAVWERNRDLTTQLVEALRERFGLESLARHPFSRLSAQALASDQVYADVMARVGECESLLDGLDSALEDERQLLHSGMPLTDAVALTDVARRIAEFNLAQHLPLLQTGSSPLLALHAEHAELVRLSLQHEGCRKATENWKDKLTLEDAQSALALARDHENSPLRWLRPAWWRLRKQMRRRYDFDRHAVHPAHSKVLDSLVKEYEAAAAHRLAERKLHERYGVADLQGFLDAVDAVSRQAQTTTIVRQLIERLGMSADPVGDARREAAVRDSVQRVNVLVVDWLSFAERATFGELSELVHDLRESSEDLPDLVPLLRSVHQADPGYAFALQRLPLGPTALEALVAQESLARIYRQNPELPRFDQRALAQASKRLAKTERALLAQNAGMIGATLQRRFLGHIRKSSQSITQLDADGRQFKKSYANGRRELEHEFGKSLRYRAIRELASGDPGAVIGDLKPVWLMSPLSVSDTLPLDSNLFDVVIFDEASQIPVEEAVPALSRACQIVVVGDEMQLPPTSFFASSSGDDDMQVIAEENGERIAINLDADSLLNQAARNLPATLLAWHYRSRHEALISFSNAAFYEGQLITIPDRRIEQANDEAQTFRNDGECVAAGVETLLARPISFHKMEVGIYANRCNLAEAGYIAGLVRELLRRETGMSLGVVAFSEAQQGEIEAALESLAAEDADFATRLEREYVREDDDQFNGLFVKNLENVQGDERDIILLSICYAPGADGRMLMNFGPINQRGGEKRLNVIFSRARHRMAVVSSIHAEAITNVHNDGASALKAFLQFAQASSRGQAERSQAVLGSLNPGAQRAFAGALPKDAFRTSLARALRQRGHDVRESVGCSQFRCDLAICASSGDGYVLAILLDAAAIDGRIDVRERYVFRPSVLRTFGWRVTDALSSDWLANPKAVLDHIEACLVEPAHTERDDVHDAIGEAIDELATTPELPPLDEPVDIPAVPMREFVFQQGTSNKFWRIGINGTDVVVLFGRIGSRGQKLTKSYTSLGRAQREVSKLVEEKLNKGYIEKSGD